MVLWMGAEFPLSPRIIPPQWLKLPGVLPQRLVQCEEGKSRTWRAGCLWFKMQIHLGCCPNAAASSIKGLIGAALPPALLVLPSLSGSPSSCPPLVSCVWPDGIIHLVCSLSWSSHLQPKCLSLTVWFCLPWCPSLKLCRSSGSSWYSGTFTVSFIVFSVLFYPSLLETLSLK